MINSKQTDQPPVLSSGTGYLTLTHVIYGLHAVSVAIGIAGAATIVGMFVTGWPSVIAVLLNYLKRNEVRGTWLESHFRWQIRTFWYSFLWGVIAMVLIGTVVGVVLGWPLLVITGLWIVYRVGRGWLALHGGKPMLGTRPQ